MGNYTVYNETKNPIFWRDGSWLSGDLPADESKNIKTDHDATVTMFSKDSSGDHECGLVIIPMNNGICKVQGKWSWTIGIA